jgi:hypothetical protein
MLIQVPKSRVNKSRVNIVVLAACVLFSAGTANASPEGMTLGYPDIEASIMNLGYDPIVSELSLTGSVSLVTYEDLSTVIVSGDFDMYVEIDELGEFSGGSFTMFDESTLLLSGELTAILESPNSLEFVYVVTGGSVGTSYEVGGLVLGYRMGGGFGFTAHAAPFASNPVPEPSAALLFVIGGAAIVARTSRRS